VVLHLGQKLGQFNELFGGAVAGIHHVHLGQRGRVNLGLVVAEQVGTPGAHEVEIFVAVGIPDAASLGTREELRVAGRNGAGGHVAPHPVGDDLRSARAERGVGAQIRASQNIG
jgi:hypothetical protein